MQDVYQSESSIIKVDHLSTRSCPKQITKDRELYLYKNQTPQGFDYSNVPVHYWPDWFKKKNLFLYLCHNAQP